MFNQTEDATCWHECSKEYQAQLVDFIIFVLTKEWKFLKMNLFWKLVTIYWDIKYFYLLQTCLTIFQSDSLFALLAYFIETDKESPYWLEYIFTHLRWVLPNVLTSPLNRDKFKGSKCFQWSTFHNSCYRPQGKVMFSQASVSHSVHNRPHGYSFTAHPCYGAVDTHPTGMLSCLNIKFTYRKNRDNCKVKSTNL